MRLDLGSLVPALRGWTLCIDETGHGCVISVRLPRWAEDLGEHERIYLALYLASRHLLDYRLAACMHIYMARNRAALRGDVLVRALGEAEVVSRIPRALEDDCPHAWEAALYRGILYAQQVLSLDKPILVKVKPPNDRRRRERLRTLLEGRRKGEVRQGLVERLGGERIAPWTYLVPRRAIPKLLKHVQPETVLVRHGEIYELHGNQ